MKHTTVTYFRFMAFKVKGFVALTGLILFSHLTVLGQSADMVTISAASFEGNQQNTSLSVTIGEPISATFSTPQANLTQGFEQPDSGIFNSVQVLKPQMNISYFPNPVEDKLYISSDEDITANVYNVDGTLVLSINCLQKSIQTVELGHLSAGVYLVSFISEKNVIQSSKFIKQ